MDKYERRRKRVQELIKLRFDNRQARFAEAIGRDANYVSRMLYPAGKRGGKRIAEDMRDAIEDACNLARGWLDLDPGSALDAVATRGGEQVPTTYAGPPTWPFDKISNKQWGQLTPKERAVVEGVALAILGRVPASSRKAETAPSLQPA